MDETITSARLQRLLNVNSGVLSTLAAEGVVIRAEKRGQYLLESSVRGYIGRPRAAARGRGGEDAQEARAPACDRPGGAIKNESTAAS